MRFLKTLLPLFVLLFSVEILAAPTCADLGGKTLPVTYEYVDDGDTANFNVDDYNVVKSVRFYGVDTPESEWKGKWPAQHYSAEAKQFTLNKLKSGDLTVYFTGEETYSRCVGEVFVNGQSLSKDLITVGFAWWNKKYSRSRRDLKNAQIRAKSAKRGLWANDKAIAPWVYRRNYR